MSEQQPKEGNGNIRTLMFMVYLSLASALILSVIASSLAKPKEIAKELDRSKQMMIAAKILSPEGYFLMKDDKGESVPAKFSPGGILVPGDVTDFASKADLIEIYQKRLIPMLVDKKGDLTSFQKAGVNLNEYVSEFRKLGYYKLPLMLIYKILPNPKEGEKTDPMEIPAEGWVIPVNGFGLWDAIYGYLALDPNGDTVIGITWYDQKETPGLGANISETSWQSLFPGKVIFQESPDGSTDFKTAQLGITVVKGKVSEVYGDSPKAKSAVDGMAGATLTGNGVNEAYNKTLDPYRPFLIKIHEENAKKSEAKS